MTNYNLNTEESISTSPEATKIICKNLLPILTTGLAYADIVFNIKQHHNLYESIYMVGAGAIGYALSYDENVEKICIYIVDSTLELLGQDNQDIQAL